MLLILVIAAVSWVELIRDRIFILPTDSIQVSKMYELSNGNIFCELSFPEEVGLVTVTGMNVPEGEVHSDSDDGEYRIYMQKDFP